MSKVVGLEVIQPSNGNQTLGDVLNLHFDENFGLSPEQIQTDLESATILVKILSSYIIIILVLVLVIVIVMAVARIMNSQQ
ncbi:MAG: hypothetical protein F6K44_03870 [Moorea sp. SIO3E2]|nr:hypothetical protein [Moorena sp. SIO3E2]